MLFVFACGILALENVIMKMEPSQRGKKPVQQHK